ncbi:NAD(P)-binding protein [Hypoxylon argillaceum]|nr:NAD(P)-binding protein [Hypoxylon argillaceum]KAI1155444.1 NAD(P)-binding protein [Nemania diffusa]
MSSVLYPLVRWFGELAHSISSSPLFSGPLLLAVVYAPDAVREFLLDFANRVPGLPAPSRNFDFATTTTVLRVLFGLSVASSLNGTLNTMATNSWRVKPSEGWDWPKEIAVVTGGSGGIGRQIVQKLAALGVRVAVLDLQNVPEAMEHSARIYFFKCDVTSPESVAKAADAVRRRLGHPSILINNAGITSLTPILKIPEFELRRTFGVNTLSHWFTAQQFVPHMVEVNKGHVVTVASIASFVALPTTAHYSASKASALSFHESLTGELRHWHKTTDVLTTVVHPSFTRTTLIEGAVGDRELPNRRRMLTPDDVAEPIVTQIKSRRGGQLIIPSWASPIAGLKAWPTWTQELLQDGVGRLLVSIFRR